MSNFSLYNVLDKLKAIADKDTTTDVSAAIKSTEITESDFARAVRKVAKPDYENDPEFQSNPDDEAYFRAQYNRSKQTNQWDDDAGYDLDDPKHPTWSERQAEKADYYKDQQDESLDEAGTNEFNLQTVLANNAEAVADYKRTGEISYELEADLHRLYYEHLSPQAQQDADDNGEIADLFAQDMENDDALGETEDDFPAAPEEKEPLVLSKDNTEEDSEELPPPPEEVIVNMNENDDPWGLGESKVIMKSTKETDPWGLGDATPSNENGVSNMLKPYKGSKRVTESKRKRSQYAQLSEGFDKKVNRNLSEEINAMVTTDATGNKNVTLTANHQTSDEEANAISNILRNAGITQAVSTTAPLGMGAMSSSFDAVGDLDSTAAPEMTGDDFGADPFAAELNSPADDSMGDMDTALNTPTSDVAIAGDYENGVDDFGTDYSMDTDDGLEGDNAIDVVGDTSDFEAGTDIGIEEPELDEDYDMDSDESVRDYDSLASSSKTTPDDVGADQLWSVVAYWTNDNKMSTEDEALVNEIGERESGQVSPQEEETLRNIAWELFDNGIITSEELDKGYYTNESVNELSKLAGLKEWSNSPKGNVEDRGNYKDDVYMLQTLAGGLNKPKQHANVNNPGDNPMNKDNPTDGGMHKKAVVSTRQRAVNETARRLEKDLLQSFKNFK
jgi:hypothetical protein